jgi:glucose/arabinose dehydrogenase
MHRKFVTFTVCVILAIAVLAAAWAWRQYRSNIVNRLDLPEGLVIEVVASDLRDARQMAMSADGRTLFVGSRRAGNVYRVRLGADGFATGSEILLKDLAMPSGLALRERDGTEDLYVAALNEIWIVQDAAGRASPRLLTDDLPKERHHGWKYLRFGPDGALYVPVGAPCNICNSDDTRFASILRMDPDTGKAEVFASGVRNSVGITFHPRTGELWFTENGRDMLGDDIPADEINVAGRAGLHFGYPFVHAGDLLDPEFGNGADPGRFQHPRHKLQAHVAPLGLAFNTGSALGETWKDVLFVTEHGSWNRSEMVGYQVTAFREKPDGTLEGQPFLTGFLTGEKVLGRPNDVLITPRGEMLISDDQHGRIFRVRSR